MSSIDFIQRYYPELQCKDVIHRYCPDFALSYYHWFPPELCQMYPIQRVFTNYSSLNPQVFTFFYTVDNVLTMFTLGGHYTSPDKPQPMAQIKGSNKGCLKLCWNIYWNICIIVYWCLNYNPVKQRFYDRIPNRGYCSST